MNYNSNGKVSPSVEKASLAAPLINGSLWRLTASTQMHSKHTYDEIFLICYCDKLHQLIKKFSD